MRKLILFLIRYSIVFLFLLLEIISFTLFVNNNRYQKSVFFSSSNTFVAKLYTVSNSFVEFFKLRSVNESLSNENADLKNQILEMENKLASIQLELADSDFSGSYYRVPEMEYKFIPAKVISNTTNKTRNYMTLNRGKADGVHPDMGVISADGAVGIVKTVSERFSVVIPLLNPMIQVSTKIVRNDYSGPLLWDGEDYRYAKLTDIPRHVQLQVGDTLVTSGLTKTFPEGIPVGIIEEFSIDEGDAYYDIKVKLAVNFRIVSQVNLVEYLNYQEQKQIEDTVN